MLVWIVYLLFFHSDLVRRKDIWTFTFGQLRTRDGVLASLNPFFYVPFVWAVLFLDTSIVTIIVAASSILFVMFRKRHDRQRSVQRYKHLVAQDWWLFAVALFGIILVILSQSGGLVIEGAWWRIPAGLALAVGSTLFDSFTAHGFKLGENLYVKTVPDQPAGTEGSRTEVACILIVTITTSTAATLTGLLVVLLSSPDALFSDSIVGLTIGGALSGLGAIAYRYANLETSNLSINAMDYLQPILALGWLWLFATVNVVRTDWLVVGATAVVAVNALINFRSEDRSGLKSLVIALLGCGFFVLMRDEWMARLPEVWFPEMGGYYGMLALIATVYILVLSFRTDRIVARIAHEDQQVFPLYRELEGLARHGIVDADVLTQVRIIDTTETVALLQKAYRKADRILRDATELDIEALGRLRSQLDSFAHSKQRGRGVAEPVVLWMLAVAVAAVSIFSRPASLAGWSALLNDMFAILLAAVVLFTARHLYDLRRDRSRPVLLEESHPDAHGVMFTEAERTPDRDPKAERTISIVIGVAVIVVYFFLIADKWSVT